MGSGVRYLVIPLVLVAACSDPAAETTTTGLPTTVTTRSTTTSTSTTAPTTTTTTAVEEIPYPDTTGDDWLKIAQEIENFFGWLFENPDMDLLEVIAVPDSPFYKNTSSRLAEYVDSGWRDLPGGRSRVTQVDLQRGSPESAGAVLVVLSEYDGSTTVDTDGKIVEQDSGREPAFTLWEIERTEETGWRLTSVDFLAFSEETG